MEFKCRHLKMQISQNFAFTNPGNVQNQIIPKISTFVVVKIKEDSVKGKKVSVKNFELFEKFEHGLFGKT